MAAKLRRCGRGRRCGFRRDCAAARGDRSGLAAGHVRRRAV